MAAEKKIYTDDRQYYRSLTRNMVIIMLLVSLAPLVLISGILSYKFEAYYREKAMAYLLEVVQKHQQSIDGFLNDKLSYIRVLADSNSIEQLSDENFLQSKLATLQKAYGGVFVDLGLVDESGAQVAYAGAFRRERADYSQADWFRKAKNSPHTISDVFLGLRGLPHFIVTAQKEEGDRSWTMRATIDFVAFNSLVENIRIGKTGTAFILNREGEFQTRPRHDASPDREFFVRLFRERGPGLRSMQENGMEDWTGRERPVMREARENEAVHGVTKHSGKELIYIMLPLKQGDWILAYEQDASDAFSAISQVRRVGISIFVLGILSIAVVVLLLARKMVAVIERADQSKELMKKQVIEAGKLASIGELAAGIAHEINNPVAIMVEEAGWMEDLLEDKGDLDQHREEFSRALRQINTQGERCKEITQKLLSFARKTDPTQREVDLNQLIEEIVAISEQRAKFGNVKINKYLAPDLPPVLISPSEVQQVFLNLINNAIDAMDSGGGTITLTSRNENGSVIVDVADTGSGIPESIVSRIFDPFFTTKPIGKGTGLGLSICYGIIQKIGGLITVSSSVGLGTVFHVHIPLARENTPSTGEGS